MDIIITMTDAEVTALQTRMAQAPPENAPDGKTWTEQTFLTDVVHGQLLAAWLAQDVALVTADRLAALNADPALAAKVDAAVAATKAQPSVKVVV